MMIRHFLAHLVVASCVLALATSAPAQGKKGGNNPPPPLPPVRYEIRYFQHPSHPIPAAKETPYSLDYLTNVFGGLNNSGECVGNYGTPDAQQHAWYFNPASMDQAIDLNDLPVVGVPEGWFLAHALDINDHGDIVGFLRLSANPVIRRGFALHLQGSPESNGLPAVTLLPDGDESWIDTYARRINENGDVLGVFQRTDGTWGAYLHNLANGQGPPEIIDVNMTGGAVATSLSNPDPERGIPTTVVGLEAANVAFAYQQGGGLSRISSVLQVLINRSGTIGGVGTRVVQVNRKQTENRYFLFRDDGSGSEMVPGSENTRSYPLNAFNAHGLFFTEARYIHHDDWGRVDLHSLLIGTPEDLSQWTGFSNSPVMNDVGPLGFGQIGGSSWSGEAGLFNFRLLTPVSAP
jgi:hypothetical protein